VDGKFAKSMIYNAPSAFPIRFPHPLLNSYFEFKIFEICVHMNRAMKRSCAQCHKIIACYLHKMKRAYDVPRRAWEGASNYKHDSRLRVGYSPDLGIDEG
jgi:hypothetical protein